MFRRPTVFVIGAGASAEVGLPVGTQLREKIVQAVDVKIEQSGEIVSGDRILFEQVVRAYNARVDDYQIAGQQIVDGIFGRNSIDEYLDWNASNREVVNLGKAAIARIILAEEAAARQRFFGGAGEFSLRKFDGLWYGHLFRMLNEGYRKEEANKIFENVQFVIFNYDRCLEYFLHCALVRMGVDAQRVEEICSVKNTFFHPYGALAPIYGIKSVGFGLDAGSVNYVELSKNIRTYSEQHDQSQRLSNIREAIAGAQVVVFLGFSYNRQNIDLLSINENVSAHEIFGSAYRLPAPDREDMSRSFNGRFTGVTNNAELIDMTCGDFLQQYGGRIRGR